MLANQKQDFQPYFYKKGGKNEDSFVPNRISQPYSELMMWPSVHEKTRAIRLSGMETIGAGFD